MVELREVVRLLLHAARPAGALAAELADDVDEVDYLDDDLLPCGDVVRQADLALAAGAEDDVCDFELVRELLSVLVSPVSEPFREQGSVSA